MLMAEWSCNLVLHRLSYVYKLKVLLDYLYEILYNDLRGGEEQWQKY